MSESDGILRELAAQAPQRAKDGLAGRPKIGRPSIYDDELGAAICGRIMEGRSLRQIVAEDGMPGLRTLMTWLLEREDFRQQYARAREVAPAFAAGA